MGGSGRNKMLPKTIIKDVRNWPILMENPRTLLKMNALFKDLGFKEVILNISLHNNFIFKDLTLLITPDLENYPSRGNSFDCSSYSRLTSFLENKKGYFADFYFRHLGNSENLKTSLFEIKLPIGVDGPIESFEMGCYIKERNCVVFYYPVWKTLINMGKDNELLWFLLAEFEKWIKKIKMRKINVDKKIMEMTIMKFIGDTQRKIQENKDIIRGSESNIREYSEMLVSFYKKIEDARENLKFLEGISKDKGKGFLKKIDEIKSLPFVKNVELSDNSVKVDVGNVVLRIGKRKYNLGNFKIIIKPETISLENDKAPKSGSTYPHPHANDGHICFGAGKIKVYELLGKLKLKELVYFMYLFLKSYNPKDPYIPLTKFIRLQNEQFNLKQVIHKEDLDIDARSRRNDDDDDDEMGPPVRVEPVRVEPVRVEPVRVDSEREVRFG